MIVVGKAPYRVSLLGGASDLDWFVDKNEYGLSLGYSLNLYSYSVLNKLPKVSKFGIINYSSRELYKNIDDIVHPLIRETFKIVDLNFLVELSTYGSASGGSGLGGSSSFLISLISSLSKLLQLKWSQEFIAQKASAVEISKLSKPIGRQDQYLAALGGISSLKFEPSGIVTQKKLSPEMDKLLRRLIGNFYLVPTNKSRNADEILSSIKQDSSSNSMILELREIARNFIESDEKRDHILESKFHESVRNSWEIKRNMSNVMNKNLEEQYEYLKNKIPNNWIRLLGAGGGGFFLISLKEKIKDTQLLDNFYNSDDLIKASISETGAEAIIY